MCRLNGGSFNGRTMDSDSVNGGSNPPPLAKGVIMSRPGDYPLPWTDAPAITEPRSLKDMVKDNKKVNFKFYRDGNLVYETDCGLEFPVPVEDIGNATFMAQDKAILFMRYIRKHLKTLEEKNND